MPKRLIALLGCAFLFASCSDDDDPNDAARDVYEAKLFPTTHELSAATLATMNVDDGSGVLVFTTAPAELTSIQPGHVILAGKTESTPSGLLRFVTAIDAVGGGVRLETVQAPLQAAFQKLHVQSAMRSSDLTDANVVVTPLSAFGPRQSLQALRAADGAAEGSLGIDEVLYDGDDDPSTTDDQILVKGAIGGRYDYLVGFDTDWGVVDELPSSIADCVLSGFSDCEIGSLLPEAKAGFELHAKADAVVNVSGAPQLQYTKDIPIASATFGAFAIGPLVFFPELRITANLLGKASAQFEVSAGAHAGVDGGVSFSTSSGAYGAEPAPFFETDTPTATVALSAEARVGVESRLRVALYKVMGPYASLTAYARVAADQDTNPCWSVDVGLDGAFGFDIGVDLGKYGYQSLADAKVPFNLVSGTVASGTCELPAGFNTLPIGAGPDPEHLANPTFTPYARNLTVTSYDDNFQTPFTGVGVYAETGTSRTYSARTIDGAFAIGATDSAGVVKVKEDGAFVWGAEYTFADYGLESKYARVGGIASNGDATILVAAQPYHLIRLTQSGQVVAGLTYDVPASAGDSPHGSPTDGKRFWDAIADANGGIYLSGTVTDPTGIDPTARVWLMHMDVAGNVIWSTLFGEGTADGYFPTVLKLAADGGVIVAGNDFPTDYNGEPHPAFLIKVDAAGNVVFAKKYQQTCSASGGDSVLVPLGGTIASSGDIILVGNADNYGAGFAMRINGQGTATGIKGTTRSGVNDYFLTAIDELPTGGFIAAGYTSGPMNGQSSLMTQILDSGLSAVTVTATQFADFSVRMSSILATDDGGALIHAAQVTDFQNQDASGLFALKVPAKNLAVTYSAGTTTSTSLPVVADAGCTVATTTWAVPTTAYAPPAHSSEVTRAAIGMSNVVVGQ